MSEMVETAQQGSDEEEPKTTVGAYWVDAGKIRELKKKLRLHKQSDVLRHLLAHYEKTAGNSGKEETGNAGGVQTG